MKELFAGKTLIIITHRLHFLDLADWVILVEDGRMVEEGTPADLRDRGGAFARYVEHEPVAAEPLPISAASEHGRAH